MNRSNEIRNAHTLPETHEFSHIIDLKKDKKVSLFIQIIFIVVAIIAVGLAIAFKFPIQSELKIVAKILLTIGFVVIYAIVHELTHGVCIHILSKKKPIYAIKLPYLTTGSKAYFNIKSFILIALAPVIVWGIVLLITIFFVPQILFLSVYVVLGVNFAGAAGDYVQVYYISKLPKDTLLQDDGTETKVFILKDKSLFSH